MNPFTELLSEAAFKSKVMAPELVSIGGFFMESKDLLTDDLAAIYYNFIDDEETIDDLVEYTSTMSYAIKIDLMFYLGRDKKKYKQLKKIKSFKLLVDSFAESIARVKIV